KGLAGAGRADAEIDVIGGNCMQVPLLVRAPPADRAALDPDDHFLRLHIGLGGARCVVAGQCQVDRVLVERVIRGLAPQLPHDLLGGSNGGLGAGQPEDVAAMGDLGAGAQLDHAQVAVKRTGEVGQPFRLRWIQGEFGNRRWRHWVNVLQGRPACTAGRLFAKWSDSSIEGYGMRAIRSKLLVTALAACVLPWALPVQAGGITVVVAERIHTMDVAHPRAPAMAYDGDGRIPALGTRDAIQTQFPDGAARDLGPATVIPGLIDAHGHVAGLGLAAMQADLVGTTSKDEALQRLHDFAATLPEGVWLLGGGWDQNRWAGKQFPTAADLDTHFP